MNPANQPYISNNQQVTLWIIQSSSPAAISYDITNWTPEQFGKLDRLLRGIRFQVYPFRYLLACFDSFLSCLHAKHLRRTEEHPHEDKKALPTVNVQYSNTAL